MPFLSYRGSRPGHFKELRTGDAPPFRSGSFTGSGKIAEDVSVIRLGVDRVTNAEEKGNSWD